MLIRAITKAKDRVIDKYTVYFYDGRCLIMSCNPNTIQGVSKWGEYFGINDADFEEAMEKNNQLLILDRVEVLINFSDLPSILKSHIEKRMEEIGK
jgi:hypothetical protein